MDDSMILELATDVGYDLAMAGAETFRVEESINRILASYRIEANAFAIPNCLIVSILDENGQPITRMRRIGPHGNDLDSVEKLSNLSRALCAKHPAPEDGQAWLKQVHEEHLTYSPAIYLLGNFLGAMGFALLFGSSWPDSFWSGICGILVGVINQATKNLKASSFFTTIAASFLMALAAYTLEHLGLVSNSDTVIIGALMLLVPGLLFTNAMRDIIYGDTNSGVNRIVQVFLIAAALALGTASAWNTAAALWQAPKSGITLDTSLAMQCLFTFIGCIGFSILYNIHGPGGLLCAAGGVLCWGIYILILKYCGSDIIAYFWASLAASIYAEIMARVRKYPAISYLVVSIFPLIPGAGVYYTMNNVVRGDMEAFAARGMHTIAIAGIMAVSILLGSTVFRMYSDWKTKHIK